VVIKTIDDLDVAGKTILVRADLNAPMRDGKISDKTRLERTAPTFASLAERGGRVVVMSHMGRPKGVVVDAMSLRPIAEALGEVMGGRKIAFATDCIGPAAKSCALSLKDGEVALLENLRFHGGEEQNDARFAAELAALGDVYVNDAFSCAHRAHASTEALARLLPAAAGKLMQAELDALTKALEAPVHPVAAVVGGAKISTKMEVLGSLTEKVDLLIIGGAMANTFLHAKGHNMGRSLCELDMAQAALDILQTAEQRQCEILLPKDAVVAPEFKKDVETQVVPIDGIPAQSMMLDIGPHSAKEASQRLKDCKTLVWNGPFGAFEVPPFDCGTNAVAQEAARLTKEGNLLSVAGGGDTVAALIQAGVRDDFSYVSTAGGAFLEWLEGKTLPGVAALEQG
jgi:phosphoglycerate kinase